MTRTLSAPSSLAVIREQFHLQSVATATARIGGQAAQPVGCSMPVYYSATEEPLGVLHESDAVEVDAAVCAARAAYPAWARLPYERRAVILSNVIAKLTAHAEELATLQTLETGIPIAQMRGMHVPRMIENFDFFRSLAASAGGQTYNQTGRYLSIVAREPVGVAAIMSPWNAPLLLCSMKLAAALAFGNTAVIKGSEYTPFSVLRMIDLMQEAGLPDGVVNAVNGRGQVTGKALVEHPDVDVIGFVGGTETGRAIMRSAAMGLKKAGLELGGKSANIVLDSANLDDAVDGSLTAIFSANGQQCLAGSRILLQSGVADEFLGRFIERAQAIRVGDPFDPSTEMGPLCFDTHYRRVLSFAESASFEKGTVLTGGRRHPNFERGYFIEPTAVMAADNTARICQEEIFGPFASVMIFDTLDQAIAIANASQFGLVGYVWSQDLASVMRVSQELQTGTVWVNTPMARDLRAAFGGYKHSGVGRDGVNGSVDLFTEEKTTMLPTGPFPIPTMGKGV